MELADGHCKACPPGSGPLAPAEVARLGSETPGWEVAADRLRRTWQLASFPEAIRFVTGIAALAEAEQHHPDLHVLYDRVEVVLWTHTVGGLSRNDFVMAAKIDRLLDDYSIVA